MFLQTSLRKKSSWWNVPGVRAFTSEIFSPYISCLIQKQRQANDSSWPHRLHFARNFENPNQARDASDLRALVFPSRPLHVKISF